jgi:para-aminobenzoate synthetase component 1
MLPLDIHEVLSLPDEARPAVLEGRWLGSDGSQAIAAARPASVCEGTADSFNELPQWLAKHAEQFPPGAAIGYFAYELARAFERLPLQPELGLPDFSFAYYPEIHRVLNREGTLPRLDGSVHAEILADFEQARFVSDVQAIQEYIAAGDIYQANLTQQFRAKLGESFGESIYAKLAGGDAPMRAFLKSPKLTIVSDSPERFFHVSNGRILASPIKGTMARTGDASQDERLVAQLLSSRKDRAENVMIVDLLRSDLGRICRYETIQARLWEVETLPHLFHLVSHVEGTLRPESGLLEILRALFPCGSITGAPKIRAMEILSQIEPVPRGVSMGAIGIITGAPGSADVGMDFSVAIRTLIIRENIASLNVGCGIVYDSDPKAEYQEMLLKARPLLGALGIGLPGDSRDSRFASRQAGKKPATITS